MEWRGEWRFFWGHMAQRFRRLCALIGRSFSSRAPFVGASAFGVASVEFRTTTLIPFPTSSGESHAGVTDNGTSVAGDVGGRCIADKFGVLCAESTQSGQHRDSRSQAAHGNIFVAANVQKAARIQGQQLVDCFFVLDACGVVVLVMIEI